MIATHSVTCSNCTQEFMLPVQVCNHTNNHPNFDEHQVHIVTLADCFFRLLVSERTVVGLSWYHFYSIFWLYSLVIGQIVLWRAFRRVFHLCSIFMIGWASSSSLIQIKRSDGTMSCICAVSGNIKPSIRAMNYFRAHNISITFISFDNAITVTAISVDEIFIVDYNSFIVFIIVSVIIIVD